MRSSACTALHCNVNYSHPRAPGEALLAPACPRSHSSTQVAALRGTLTCSSGSSCSALQSPGASALQPSPVRQGEEAPGLPCCSSEPAAPQGRGPSICSSSRPGAHAQLPEPSCPAPGTSSGHVGFTHALGAVQTSCSPLPTAPLQQRKPAPASADLQASPHACPGHHTLFAPSTKSECFETQPGQEQVEEHRNSRDIFRVLMGSEDGKPEGSYTASPPL